jgi:mannose-6-phosphate isomerase-like protein (cupin superfamily)
MQDLTPEVLQLTPHETVAIRESSAALLEVEGEWGSGGKPPPPHYHPAQDEHFEVLEGTLTARVDGEKLELGRGETLDIPSGVHHQIWNESDEPARALWQTRPAGRTEQWFRCIDSLFRDQRVGRGGMPSPLAFGVYLTEFRDVFRLGTAPDIFTRPVLAALALIGRARGYKVEA